MKKTFALLLLLGILSSCSLKNDITINVLKDESIFYVENNKDIEFYTVSLNEETLQNKINNDDSFVLLLYGKDCHACNSIKPYIINYICSNQYIFYSFEYIPGVTSSTADTIISNLYEFESIAYPRVYFIKDGQCFFVKNGFTTLEHSNRNIEKLFDYYIK